METELVVVGGGVAGCTAALYAKRYNLDLMLLEKSVPGGQTATAAHIENYPGFPDGISGPDLAERVLQQAKNLGVEVTSGAAESVERRGDEWVIGTSASDVTTKALIVAAGASPRRLDVPGETELSGRGVSYCATCDGMFFRGEAVAVAGGGNTAIDEAIYLSDICEKVYVIHRRDELRAEAHLQERAFARPNIEFVWDSAVSEILGEQGVTTVRVRNKKTDQQRDLPVTGMFVSIGHEPQTRWLGGLVELADGFIVTDMNMATRAPGVFAAGDIRDTPLRQVTTAVGDASIAAFSAWQYVSAARG